MYHDNASGCEQTSAPKNSTTWKFSTATTKSDRPSSTSTLTPPKRLIDKHFTHCCGTDTRQKQRGLNPDWIAANCYSVLEKEASRLLGYRAKSGGIVIEGANGQFQFRPDRPWRSDSEQKENGKAPKYRTASGDEYDALLPRHPDNAHYWLDLEALKQQCWQINGLPHLLITEGGFKAICACSKGLPTIALLGVEMGLTSSKTDPQGKRYLVPSLEFLAKKGFGFIIGFDADISTKEAVQKALYKLGHQLQKFNTSVYVMPQWDETLGKGIDDYMMNQGIERFREILAKSITFEAWAGERSSNNQKLTPLQRAWQVINAKYQDRLRFNELTLSVELDKEAADLDGFYLDLELLHNCSVAKDKAYDLAVRCAKQNPYHPVKDYLNHVAHTAVPIDIRNLSQRYFGTIDPIYNEMMYRHLIGSVARVFNPGCKKDESVILKGKQGLLKSTFWKTLYGEEFFSDSLKGTDRDDLLVLHQYWALELAEFETITSKKQAGDLKAFLSAGVDTFREPYGRHSKPRKRQSVIVGSVNPDSFLVDETGNRRYWVIPVKVNRINIFQVAAERDGLWAAAVAAYRNGERWHLSDEDEQQISQLNGDYCHSDSWEVPISHYVSERSLVTTFEVLINALDFDKARIGKRDEMRVANVLRSLGWEKTLASYLGKRQRVWIKSDPPGDQPLGTRSTSDFEVDRPAKLDSSRDVAISDPPDPPFNQTLLINSHHHDDDGQSKAQSWDSEVVTGGSSQPEALAAQALAATTPGDQPTTNLRQEIKVDQPDYSTYPHRTSDDIRAKEKRANKCLEAMLACTTSEELARFRNESGFSNSEIDWVYRHTLTPSQQQKVQQAAAADQLNLLTQPTYKWNDLMAAIEAELNRLGWTTQMAQNHLHQTYGVKSRLRLTDGQVIEFWNFLKTQ